MDIKYYSPATGEELVMGTNGLLYSPTSDAVFKVNKKGNVVPLKNPTTGEELHLSADGFLYNKSTPYEFKDGNVMPVTQEGKEEDKDVVSDETNRLVTIDDLVEQYGKEIVKEGQEVNKENEQEEIVEALIGDLEQTPVEPAEEVAKEEKPEEEEDKFVEEATAEESQEDNTDEETIIQSIVEETNEDYQTYRAEIIKIISAENEEKIHSIFKVEDELCYHHLIKEEDGKKETILKQSFAFNADFKKNLLEPLCVEFIKLSPLLSSRILLPTKKAKRGTYEGVFKNNKTFIVDNIDYNYLTAISNRIKSLDYMLYNSTIPDVEVFSLRKARNGFIRILPMVGFIAVVYGIGFIVASIFIK